MESTRWRNCVDLQWYMDSLLQFAGYLDTPLRMSTRSYISSEEVFSSLNNSTFCSKQQEARGLHSVSALFLPKSTHHSEDFFKTGVFKQHKIQDPPTFCSKQQEAWGLHSVSALFLQKSAHHQEDFFKIDHFKTKRTRTQLYPNSFLKNPGICSGALRRRIKAISREDPLVPCAKQQEAQGLHPNGSTFFFKKVQTTRRFHKALHGFAQESTRMTLVSTWQDMKEQDEASRTQP